MRERSTWKGNGRATIDPNHSPRVEGDHYLSATTPAQRDAVDTIIEDAQHDLTRRARPPIVLADEQTVALARDYPELAASLQLDAGGLNELVGGQRDVFTAACADQLSGLHGPKGKPGPALGVSAVSPRRVRTAARTEPAAAEELVLPAMAEAAERPVHGRVRALLPAGRAGPGPLRPRRAGRGHPADRRPRRRTTPAP